MPCERMASTIAVHTSNQRLHLVHHRRDGAARTWLKHCLTQSACARALVVIDHDFCLWARRRRHDQRVREAIDRLADLRVHVG